MRAVPVHLHQTPVPGEERYVSPALVNTRFALTHGPVDLLADPGAAHLWLVRHTLLPDHIALDERQFASLLGVRDAIRDLFTAHAARATPSGTSLDMLNSALAAAPSTLRLGWHPTGPHRTAAPAPGDPAAAALALLAEDTVDLLTGPDAAHLTECAAQGCARWFLRSHGARRWCSTKCGNRVRAARAYAAKKEREA